MEASSKNKVILFALSVVAAYLVSREKSEITPSNVR